MEERKGTINQYKWVLLAGVIVAILIGLITANFRVLQFMNYKLSNDAQGIVSTLQSSVSQSSQREWYFKQGMAYLLKQDEYSEEIRSFFETNFNAFDEKTRLSIIEGYNAQKISLPMNKDLMTFLVSERQSEAVKNYIQRITPDEMENALMLVYGKQPEVNEAFITNINALLAIYPEKLPFEKFQFSLYRVLALAGDQGDAEIKDIFEKISAESARAYLFKELKSKTVTEEQLVKWVKLFKDTNVVTLSEATQFDSLYSDICLIRSQYDGMDEEKIALQNKKDSVEAQISDAESKLQAKQDEVAGIQSQINEIESKLDKLTSYTYMTLYIEGPSATGENEYIASQPRGGLFGILKPSAQKNIVKLTNTSYVKDGIYNLNVFPQGCKDMSGGSYPYYVEVSNSDISNMEELDAERKNKAAALDSLNKEAQALQTSIDTVKKDNNYDEVVEALNNMDDQKNEYLSKINEKAAAIKELFGLTNFTVAIDQAAK